MLNLGLRGRLARTFSACSARRRPWRCLAAGAESESGDESAALREMRMTRISRSNHDDDDDDGLTLKLMPHEEEEEEVEG